MLRNLHAIESGCRRSTSRANGALAWIRHTPGVGSVQRKREPQVHRGSRRQIKALQQLGCEVVLRLKVQIGERKSVSQL